MNFQEKIKKWVVLDNNYRKYSEELKKLREEKNKLCNEMTMYYNDRNMKFPIINISDGKLNLVQQNISNPISIKFLENCFNEYFEDDEKTKDLLNFIKSKRIYTKNEFIKRTYN